MFLRNSKLAALGALIFLGLSLGLTSSELAVRAFHLAPAVASLSRGRFRLSANPKIAYEPVPFYSNFDHAESDMHLKGGFDERANSLGYRDREHNLTKDPRTIRIAVIGDSLSMGFGIDDRRDIYTSVLEHTIQGRGLPTEVLNFGVSGYNTEQEVETLHDKGLQFSPDMVLLQFCMNDFHDPWPANAIFTSTLLKQETTAGGFAASRMAPLLQQSALYRFMRWRVAPRFNASYSISPDEQIQRLKADTVTESLARLRQMADRQSFRVLVAVFPSSEMGAGWDRELHSRIGRLARAEGFGVVDLLAAFEACRPHRPALFMDNFHPTVAGHDCAGTALADALGQLPIFKARVPAAR